MLGDDELIFSGRYKDFRFEKRFNLSTATEKDVAAALLYISQNIEQAGYKFSGIEYEKIDGLARKLNGAAEVASYLREGNVKKMLEECAKDKKLMPAVESCFLNLLLSRAGLETKPKLPLALKAEEYREEGRVVFIGKYRDWVAIKKLLLSDVEADWEVAGIIASTNMTAVNKAFQLAETGYAAIENEARGIAAGKRKSFAAAAEIIEKTANNPILLTKALESVGYYSYLSLSVLMDAYPELKPKKPKGRAPKG